MRKFLLCSLAALFAVLAVSCSNPFLSSSDDEDNSVKRIAVDPTSVIIGIGETKDISATVYPSNASDRAISWYSDDSGLLDVEGNDTTAVITGNACGVGRITAKTANGVSDACAVTIAYKLTITLHNEDGSSNTTTQLSIYNGETVSSVEIPVYSGHVFSGWYTQANGQGTKITFPYAFATTGGVTSYDLYAYWQATSTKVTVTYDYGKGSGTPPSATDTVGNTITLPTPDTLAGYTFSGWYAASDFSGTGYAAGSSYTLSSTETLYAKWIADASVVHVTGISVSPTTVDSLAAGSTTTIKATITPDTASDKTCSWKSSDSTIATVDQSGVVTGVKTGTVTITATATDTTNGTITATSSVTITNTVTHVESISLDKTTIGSDGSFKVGGTAITLTATVLPENATDRTFTWSSSDTGVATVKDGVVTAVAKGNATITATTTDGAKTATCKVTVSPNTTKVLSSLSITPSVTSISVNGTSTFTAEATYDDKTTADVTSDTTFTSMDTTIGTISSVTLTGVKGGDVTVSASYSESGVTKTATTTITVVKKLASLTITPSATTVAKDATVTFTAKAAYDDATTAAVTATYTSGTTTVATISGSTLTGVAKGSTIVTGSYTENSVTKTATKTIIVTEPITDKIIVHCPTSLGYTYIYAWTGSGTSATKYAGDWPGTTMPDSDSDGYYDYTLSYTSSNIIFNKNGTVVGTGKTNDLSISAAGEYWYIGGASGAGTSADWTTTDPNTDIPTITVSPTSSITPASTITITCTSKAALTAASVTIAVNGTTKKTLALSDLSDKTETIDVSGWSLASGDSVTISGTVSNASYTSDALNTTLTVSTVTGVNIYISASSAPTIWVWQPSGLDCSTQMGYTWKSQPTMSAATGLKNNDGWYVFNIPTADYTSGKTFSFKLNSGSATITTTKTATFWYDAAGSVGTAGTYYDSDPTTVPEPVSPSVTVKPASTASLALSGSIVITLDDGNDTITAAPVTVKLDGTTAKTYAYSNFTNDILTIKVSDITTTAGKTVAVTASVTNSVGSKSASTTYTTADVKVDTFTWDNALVYFVITDRFYNGDSTNDHSYNRKNTSSDSSIPAVATFHGGDIKGLTDKLDYLNTLGVNAIWITAPYEQIHGWVSGKNSAFPHYSFHGYYTLDWTEMDKNMGTVEEFRTFVDAAHAKGIRVIMDIVMNHTGYNTVEDMITYSFGSFSGGTPAHGWIASTNGTWQANTNGTWTVLWGDGSSDGQGWEKWWCSWVRAFDGKYGYQTPGSSDETLSLAGLPDVYTESSTAVSVPTFLSTKWNSETSGYTDWIVPAAEDYRKTVSGYSPHDYIEHWLASWVREFGIDGFRVDTAKHVERVRWGELKTLCESALSDWRADTTRSSSSAAKNWDEGFWMTGECWGWNSLSGSGEYYTTGKFDSMINFSFNGSTGNNSGSVPTTSTWSTYASAFGNSSNDSDGNGNHNSVLSYLSSHDTGLTRQSDQLAVGTMFELLPGGVQIFYGDESSRSSAYTDSGDTDMQTRGDMNFGSNTSCVTHWGKVGTFRKYNPAVGAGSQTVSGSTYVRSYSGTAGSNNVAISISSTTLTGLPWSDGTTIYNWYDGKTTTVSSGSATFSSSSASSDAPVLASDVKPADCGVTF